MKKSLILLPLLFAATACQKAEDQSMPATVTEDAVTTDVSSSPMAKDAAASASEAAAAPDIDTSVAPGVAFDFRYVFSLASDRIGGVQEDHAQACKKLGIARCRVTGMDYKANGNGEIAAMMAFKLDPAIATDFTRDAKSIVEKAEGELASANLSGTDVGSNIAATESNSDQIRGELASIDAQIKTLSLGKDVRARLVERAAELREQLRSNETSTRTDKAALAMTPVLFEYKTANSIAGFNTNSSFTGALATSLNGFGAMLKVILVIFGALAPWALLAGLVYFIARRFMKKPAPVDAG
jgi:hypothetical protein